MRFEGHTAAALKRIETDFMAALRSAWGARLGLPATRWMARLGALAMRTDAELVLKSRYVVPARLLEAGFGFDFPAWPDAARELVARRRDRTTPAAAAPGASTDAS